MRQMPEPPTETIVWGSWGHIKAEIANEKYYGGYIFGSRTAYKRALTLGIFTPPFIFFSPLVMKIIHRLLPRVPGILKWIIFIVLGLATMGHVFSLDENQMQLYVISGIPTGLILLIISCYVPWRKVAPRAPRDLDLAEVQKANRRN